MTHKVPRTRLEGRVFGRLTVLRWLGDSKWLCRCSCGNEVPVQTRKLKSGHTRSCGCLQREACTTHGYLIGMSGRTAPRTYRTWSLIIQRCTNPKADWYHRYGGRGITVCRRWRKFANFLADMGEAPPGLSIERIKNNKGYMPSNCRWATPEEQSNNTCQVRKITFRGEAMSLARWCRRVQVNYGTARYRLVKRGYPLERVFSHEKQYSYGRQKAREERSRRG